MNELFIVICLLIYLLTLATSYDWLVNGSAQALVEKFMQEEHSFDQYTQVSLLI